MAQPIYLWSHKIHQVWWTSATLLCIHNEFLQATVRNCCIINPSGLLLTYIMHSETHAPNSASSNDVGRAEVYKTKLVQAQAGNGECIVNMNQYSWRATLVYRSCPSMVCPRFKGWFSPSIENCYNCEWQSYSVIIPLWFPFYRLIIFHVVMEGPGSLKWYLLLMGHYPQRIQ